MTLTRTLTISTLHAVCCWALMSAAALAQTQVIMQSQGESGAVPRYGVSTLPLRSNKTYENPYLANANVAVTFLGITGPAAGRSFTAQGYWDGGQNYQVRFAPPAEGLWRWHSTSSDSSLNAKSGVMVCRGALPATHISAHGPVREARANPYTFAHEDGTPFFLLGDTQWSFSTAALTWPEEFQTYVDARAAQGFNYIHGVVYQIYPSENSANEGGLPFYEHDPDQLNPAFWQAFDRRVAYMNEKGLVVGLLLAWADDAWKYFLTEAQVRRFAQYLLNRYAAYNVFWIMAGEYEEATPPGGFAALGEYFRRYDPYQHPRTIHTVDTSSDDFGAAGWQTTIYQQIFHSRQITPDRRFNKPVVNSEFGYEGDQSAEAVRQDAWEIVMRGGFAVYGDTNTFHANAVMSDSNLYSPGAGFMTILKKFWTNNGRYPFKWEEFDRFEQIAPRRLLAGKRGVEYLVYADTLGEFNLTLPDLSGNLFGRWFDTRRGKWTTSFSGTPAGIKLTPPDSGCVAYLAPRADITPPRLLAVQARALNATSALLTWQTDEPTQAEVAYGLTPAYGAAADYHTGWLTQHAHALYGLRPEATYHLRVQIEDATGNTTLSSDLVFRTEPSETDTLQAEQIVLYDSLNGRTRATRTGGRFVREGGWQVTDTDNMLVYDLGRYLRHGSFEVAVRNFDPAMQNFFTRHHLMSMFRNPWGNHHPIENTETVWDLHAGYAYRGGLKMLSWTYDENERNSEVSLPWDRERTYRFKLVWQGRQMQFFIDDSLLAAHTHSQEMELRYLYLGRDHTVSGDLITEFHHNQYPAMGGPIFSNVEVKEILAPRVHTATRIDTIAVENVYANAARLQWSTTTPAVCYVEYGSTAAYGSRTPALGTPAKSFSTVLAKLTPRQTYHFRIVALDEARQTIYSADQVLTTLAGGVYLFKPEADAFVEQASLNAETRDHANYGFMALIAGAGREAYLRFQVNLGSNLAQKQSNNAFPLAEQTAGLTARLRLHGRQSGASRTLLRELKESWAESEVTWLTKPKRLGPSLGLIQQVRAGEWQEVQLDTLVLNNGVLNLALIGGGQQIVAFDSRESENAQPELLVFTNAPAETPFTGLETSTATPPLQLSMSPRPNPFREHTRFDIVLPRAGQISLKVFDVQGREVAAVWDGKKEAGRWALTWNSLTPARQALAAGVYFAVLRYHAEGHTAPQVITQRLVMLK